MENPDQQPMSKKKINPSPSIDDIPDDILIHILSFLPTKTSVSTSILARRWRFLWTHAPNLHFIYNRWRFANYVSDGDDDGSLEIDDYSDYDDDDSDDDDYDEQAYNKEEEEHYALSMLEFVSRLANVKRLKLTTRSMDAPGFKFSTWIIKFNNLTKLELRGDWRFIPSFLENADNLETLIICGDDEDLKRWIEPKEVPSCLVSHLGIFKIFSFGCEDQEFLMIEYILRNSKVLKKVEVNFQGGGDDLGEKDEAVKKISLFPMGSEECEFEFC